MTLTELRTRPEGQTFDCKSIQVQPKALALPIVAMANADGGVVAVGVSDTKREFEGIDRYPQKLNEILRVPFDFCIPSVQVTFTYLPCTRKDSEKDRILLINVPASQTLHTNQADECYMRTGDKSRKLSFDERMQLMYDKGERYYENTAVYGAQISDIDLATVKKYTRLIGYGKKPLDYLRENNAFVRPNPKTGEDEVSTACILLFGKRPQNFFPRARTRFIRYNGTEEKTGTEMNVIKDVTFEGTILDQVQKAIEFIETQVAEHTFLGQKGIFITRRDYPEFAIQEMVVNACCHRAYNIKGTEIQIKMFDDRIVFESPGRLPGLVRPDNIRHTHFSRNPLIAQFLKAHKYVKEFGEGIDRICRELNANGTPAPKITDNDFILRVSLYKITAPEDANVDVNAGVNAGVNENAPINAPVNAGLYENVDVNAGVNAGVNENADLNAGVNAGVNENAPANAPVNASVNQNDTPKYTEKYTGKYIEKLTETQKTILILMSDNPYITQGEIAQILNIDESTVWRNIKKMQDKYIQRVGSDKTGFWEITNIPNRQN